jgi:hypothetical protein
MPSFHINISTGPKGAAFEHAQYIAREGRFADEEKYGPVIAQGQANFPEWAREDRNAFWTASDEFERANGNTYREYELALPRELSREQQIALVERFAEQELGSTRVYQWAIHEPNASDGKPQPHVHLMFSDRQLDGIERGPEKFFKRYNSKNPERGGAQKFSYGEDKAAAARTYEGIRERWATVQNLALEHVGVEARVDHRSLAAQGIRDREPELHRGPAVSGIEARGEVSEVGRRQREQRLERTRERESVVAEVRVVTREEMALERVAVRERRELAQGATGEDREAVLKRVEADRLEQIQRAQAAAERRVERRQGLSIGGQIKETLLTQARELRARIGQQFGRVKEWIAERFPDPLQQLKERSRDLFDTVVEKAQRALGREAGQEQAVDKTAARKRGLFDGLQLGSGPPEGVQAPPLSAPATPAATAPMSLAEQLELRSNEVAARLDREARSPRGREIEGAGLQRERAHDAPGRQPANADRSMEFDDRRPASRADEKAGGEVVPQRLQPSEGAKELSVAEQLQARADEVSRRVEQELAQDRAVRAEVERQRVLEETQKKQRGRTRNRQRVLGDDDEFTRGRGR